jgi:hypothetical protein
VDTNLVLQPLVPMLEFSQVLFVLPWWTLCHTWKVFNELHVRLQEL